MLRRNDDELQQLQQIAHEQNQAHEVEEAHVVIFCGQEHVHINLKDGDIVVTGTNPDEALHIECR